MTRIALTLALLGVPVFMWAGDVATEKAKLQGSWAAVAVLDRGKPEPEERVKMLKLLVKDDKYIYEISGKSFSAMFKLDPKEKPAAIDITFEEGPIKGKTMKAIYVIEDDTLKICAADERPKEFAGSKENGAILFTFKREK
jgi:uncharacterized protein (TIGR03067 family)